MRKWSEEEIEKLIESYRRMGIDAANDPDYSNPDHIWDNMDTDDMPSELTGQLWTTHESCYYAFIKGYRSAKGQATEGEPNDRD